MRHVCVTLAIAAAALGACSARAPDAGVPGAGGIRLERVASGLRSPVHLAALPGDPRLFVVEQVGAIRVVENGRLRPRPFLDLSDRIRNGGERGLLSLAFHPRYRANGYFFVNYTDRSGDTRVERYRVSPDSNVADPASASLILTVEQPYSNHNGGHVLFGPDGMLYIGMGDGGSADDPLGSGQDLRSLLGKLLRIDVDGPTPYAVPRDNPLVGRRDARPEIWAWGLRNPWRMAFDPPSGLLYIADVGQNRWEEIHVAPAARGGLNYGWNLLEGSHCFRRPGCSRPDLERPALEYSHEEGCSVTGGLVYRGRGLPHLVGHYFYADYCEGWIRSFRYDQGRATDRREWPVGRRIPVSSFGTDGAGELYVVSHDGEILKMVAGGTP
jgi:glucose/arabinose dehydrogenase